jgi:thiamine-monophosphate kinase
VNPFTHHAGHSVAALGESALLRAIRGWLGDVSPPSPWGMGDDCAVIETGDINPLLATTDGVVFGRHFDVSAPPAAVGAKLLKRNLSDIAAMGGKPGPALINLFLAPNLSTAWLEQFYGGLAQSCLHYGVRIVGGDLVQAPDGVFAAHLTLLGSPGKHLLKRTGAHLGDALYVTGELGGSILGHHLDFTPRLAEGHWLARQRGVRCLIDLTDGLAKDLPEILPAGADASLDLAALPISVAARKLAAKRHDRSALVHALTDGEDYELLFSLDASVSPGPFAAHWREKFPTPLTRLGLIAPALDTATGHDRQLRDAATGALLLPAGTHGYEHLR